MTSSIDAGIFTSCFSGSREDDSGGRPRRQGGGQQGNNTSPSQTGGPYNLPCDLSELGRLCNIYVETTDALKHTQSEEDSFILKVRKGVAVIIANENFDNSPKRAGAKKDLTEMYDLFNNKLKYTTYWLLDGTTFDLQKFLYYVTTQKAVLKEADCLVLVISSHGSENPVKNELLEKHYPNNFDVYEHYISTKDGEMKTLDIMDAFDENHCRELKNKPKIVFLQACSARHGKTTIDSLDTGVEVELENKKPKLEPAKFFAPPESSMDAKGAKPPTFVIHGKTYTDMTDRQPAFEEIISVAPPPCYHNCMVVMASPSERVAWSDSDKGGWLLYCLYQVMNNYIRNSHTINLQQAVTEISHMMALSMESHTDDVAYDLMKCVPAVTHMLMHDIVLVPPGVVA